MTTTCAVTVRMTCDNPDHPAGRPSRRSGYRLSVYRHQHCFRWHVGQTLR